MLKNKTAIVFHKYVCSRCHTIPKYEEWIRAPIDPGLRVFHVASQRSKWEPVFIGTNSEPYFDEKLSWEGRRNKMTLVSIRFFQIRGTWSKEREQLLKIILVIFSNVTWFHSSLDFQAYTLCILDYELQILDNAFLIHRPGIKHYKKERFRNIANAKTNTIIENYSYPELNVLYGHRKGCFIG